LLIVGEKINTSRKLVQKAVKQKDEGFIRRLARSQQQGGANMIDVNCGTFIDDEPELMRWLTELVQEETNLPACIDSPNPEAIRAALEVHKGKPLINSISGEKERYNAIVPLVGEYDCDIVALTMDDTVGIPADTDTRMRIASELIQSLDREGIDIGRVYIDPLIQPVSTDSNNGRIALETIRRLKLEFPKVHVICGLSNISFGLPERKLLNEAFLAMAIAAGMDAVIMDPTEWRMPALVAAGEVLSGADPYCGRYLKAYRKGILKPK